METMMAAGLVLNPIGIAICVLIPAIAIFFLRRPGLSAGRLISGYVGALCALALGVAVSSYMSPAEAKSLWHVSQENYWGAMYELFLDTFAVVAFAAIVGISFVGLPILVKLSKVGMATAPWLILTSVAISAAVAILYCVMGWRSSSATLMGIATYLLISHAVSATGFALAARLPWSLRTEIYQ